MALVVEKPWEVGVLVEKARLGCRRGSIVENITVVVTDYIDSSVRYYYDEPPTTIYLSSYLTRSCPNGNIVIRNKVVKIY